MYTAVRRMIPKPPIDKEIIGWPGGYMSTGIDGVIPETALADMTNLDMSQNSLPYIRKSTSPYGKNFVGTPIGVDSFRKTIANGVQENWEISAQVVATNEVQTLTITGTPTGGTFTLTFNGQTTAAIAYNAAASAVQSALEALSNIAVGDVVCDGGTLPGTAVTITFQGAYANTDVAALTTTGSFTGGTSPAASIAETLKGGNRGAIYVRKDGADWTLVPGYYRYDTSAWVSFTLSNARVFITNGVNNLSYYDVETGTIVTYTEISTPTAPTVTPVAALTSGTRSYTLYYVITALKNGFETDGSVETSTTVNALREAWDGTTQYIDLSWTAVSGADGYVIYVGTVLGDYRMLATVTGTSYRDAGNSVAAITKAPPLTNATGGPILAYAVNILGQLYGWGDKDHPANIWYDGGGEGKTGSGNFTVSGGGGYFAIDDGGPSIPVAVLSYRDGHGDPVPTVICNGANGTGGVRHINFTPETIGDLTALMPSVTEANGDVGCISPLACVSAEDSIHFPTGLGFEYEGSAPNIPNILSARRSSDFIQPDVEKLSKIAMNGARGLYFEGRIYFSLPVISTSNNQIWVLDLRANPARWIMPWPIPAKHMWLHEDNSGTTHFCLLVNNQELEFTDVTRSNDNGTPFRTRCASGPIRWDKAGITAGYIQTQRFKLINLHGDMTINVLGATLDNQTTQETLTLSVSGDGQATGFGEFQWGVNQFGEDPGIQTVVRPASRTEPVPMKTKLSELSWEILTDTTGCAYSLAATHTQGVVIPKLYAGD